ncbi:MAG: ABC transporter permease [Clostridia bacterium]|nr:ABC transporter permease [Clostridia bacterium]
MLKYVGQRLLAMLITLVVIITLVFCMIRMMPGGIYDELEDISQAELDALYAKYNLDKPIGIQYLIFLKKVVTKWDWGYSLKLYPNVPVWNILGNKIPITIYENIFALVISLPLGILFGIWAAIRKNTIIDYAISVAVVICISVPSFVFASLLQYFLGFKLGLFPIVYNVDAVGFARFYSMTLPIVALALGPIARVTRYLRAELAETINSDFMLLARTKGLTEAQATVRHGIRNSLLPILTTLVSMFTHIMSGSLVIESIFGIPGMGGLMIKAINSIDYNVTQATLMFYSIISLGTTLLCDLLYGVVDPRIRVGGKKE